MILFKLNVMMTHLNVSEHIVEATTKKIEQNIAWKSSANANDIRKWLENRVNPSTVTESSTTTTDQTSTVTSTSTVRTSTTNAPGSASKTACGKIFFLMIFFAIFTKIIKF